MHSALSLSNHWSYLPHQIEVWFYHFSGKFDILLRFFARLIFIYSTMILFSLSLKITAVIFIIHEMVIICIISWCIIHLVSLNLPRFLPVFSLFMPSQFLHFSWSYIMRSQLSVSIIHEMFLNQLTVSGRCNFHLKSSIFNQLIVVDCCNCLKSLSSPCQHESNS